MQLEGDGSCSCKTFPESWGSIQGRIDRTSALGAPGAFRVVVHRELTRASSSKLGDLSLADGVFIIIEQQ